MKNTTTNFAWRRTIICFASIEVIIFCICRRYWKNRMEMEFKVYEKQIKLYQKCYEEIKRSGKEILSFRHDMNNHFSVLRSICERGKVEKRWEESLREIEKYLNSIGVNHQRIHQGSDSGNLLLDALLDMKRAYAVSRGIIMTVEVYVPREMDYDSMELTVVLGNLLDNAIEACERLGDEKEKEIKVKIRYMANNLFIMLKNTYNGWMDGKSGSISKGDVLMTSKMDRIFHGIGMRNVSDIVNRYDGDMRWRAEGCIFTIEVLLYGFGDNTQ